jgi:putative spermidine/putrescine transport system ATP-binding protein
MARALALEPKLFLLDEPLSALDAKLREEMQDELRLLQERLGITTIIVTHDQREAMTMSDQVVVMSTAHIQQMGPPLEIYRNPASAFVAEFIGTSNLVNVKVVSATEVEAHGERFTVESMADGLTPGSDAVLSVRPEEVHVLPASHAGPNQINGKVTFIRDVGASIETFVDCGDMTIISLATPKERPDLHVGDVVNVELPTESCVVVKP